VQFPGFNGKIGEVRFNIGAGSFKNDKKYDHPDDIFGFKAGETHT